MRPFVRTAALAAPLTLVASLLGAQLSLGLRGTGSFPTGDFANQTTTATANTAVINGAKNGFGYGLDAGLSLGPIGIYAGFDHIKFDCQTTTCKTDGKYTLQGVTAGVKLSAGGSMLRPFVKGGVTLNDLQGGYGGSSSNTLTTDTTPGYEVGVGLDISFAGILSFAPQARYIGQNLKAKVPGVTVQNAATGTGVNYFTFDMGLAVHTPFGK